MRRNQIAKLPQNSEFGCGWFGISFFHLRRVTELKSHANHFFSCFNQDSYGMAVESIVAPIVIAVIILIVCALIAVNMILLLCAAWIVLYAGLIFLGFGGCRWTSDMAINYYRTVLGVGVSLMTMQLIIGIGVQFLQQLVASTSQNLDAAQIAVIMCAAIILAVISHRLPQMVAGMVVGGGHNGAIGGVGMMTLFAAGMTGMGLASRLSGNPAAMLATEGVGEGAKMLQDRIAAAEAAMGSQKTQASGFTATNGPGDALAGAPLASKGSSSSGSGNASPTSSFFGRVLDFMRVGGRIQ
ncbi:MAG TPA: type IV secretion system protein [Candidatus Acidoferrum sp.]|nr:type IV secretion system protein [Candidatus Acidoferrum sp.]